MKHLVFATMLVLSASISYAQDVSPDEAERLGEVKLQWEAEGLDESNDTHWPRMTEIAHSRGFMTEIPLWLVNEAVYASKSLRANNRIVNVQIDCRSLDSKYEALRRMERAFRGIGLLYTGGAAVAAAGGMIVPWLGIPLSAVLLGGSVIANGAAWYAGWWADSISSTRKQANCAKGGAPWIRTSPTLRTEMLSPHRRLTWSFGA
jgi:hypothetical protein